MSINAPNRIKKKYLDSDSVDGSKVLFLNEESFRAKSASNGQDVELFKLSSQNKFTLLKLPSVSIDPTDMYDIVNKKYVDDEIYTEKTRAMMREAELEGLVDAEELRAKAREDELEGMIDDEALTRASEDIRILSEAKAYTDSEIYSNVTSKLGQANGIATLDGSGKISTSQLPAMSLTDVYVVTTLAQRDALTVQEGDVVKVTEAITRPDGTKLPRTYIYDGSVFVDITTESDVDSVNGQVGHVVLNTSHISESGDSRYFTAAREQSVKDYVDMEVSEEAGIRASEDIRILSEANTYTDMEVSEEAGIRASEDLTFVKLDGSRPLTGDLDVNGKELTGVYGITGTPLGDTTEININSTLDMDDNRIIYLPLPTESHEAATKGYVDYEINTHVTSKLGQPDGIATLDGNGKILYSQIPQLAITDVHVVLTMAERDALMVQEGDIVKVIEGVQVAGEWFPKSFIWAVDDVTGVGMWVDIATEPHVDSINGQVGAVVLDTDDISELPGATNKYFTDTRAQTAAVVDTLSGSESNKAPSVRAVKEFIDDFGERYQVDSFTVNSTIISQNYIELSSKAFSMSIVPSISRLMLLEGDDYTVSVVAGKTRLTFVNSLLQGGDEALEVGDRIRIRYLKDLSV